MRRGEGQRLPPGHYVSSKASVWPGFKPGENCFILEDNTMQPFVVIGDNVTLWSGNHIGHHARIGDQLLHHVPRRDLGRRRGRRQLPSSA